VENANMLHEKKFANVLDVVRCKIEHESFAMYHFPGVQKLEK